MDKVYFAIRLIALTMGLAACSGLNQESIAQDVELLEEISEDVVEFMHSEPVEPKPVKDRLLKNPRMHDKVINLNYEVGKKSSVCLA